MATDATGTPTPKGIPKYDPANDAPSGLGFNAAMDAIDDLIINKPSGIVAQEGLLWDGAAWVRYDPASHQATATISAANTDLAWTGGNSTNHLLYVSTAGGTLRSIGAPTGGAGTRLTLRNAAATTFVVLNMTAGGSGVQIFNSPGVNESFDVQATVEYIYDGSLWIKIGGQHSGWQGYTPTWTSDGTQPALNNGTLVGRFVRIGKTIHAYIQQAMGSTTTYGTGNYFWSPPIDASANLGGSAAIGSAGFSDVSTGFRGIGVPGINGVSSFFIMASASPGGSAVWGSVTPVTWANGDLIRVALTYEAG